MYDGAGQVTPPSPDNPNPDWSGVAQQIVDSDPTSCGPTTNRRARGDHGRRRSARATTACGPATRRRTASSCSARTPRRCSTSTTSQSTYIVDVGRRRTGHGRGRRGDDHGTARPRGVRRVHHRLDRGDDHGADPQPGGDERRHDPGGIVAAANEVTVDFGGLAPTQTWSGEPNEYIVRESYIYDVDLAASNQIPLGDGDGVDRLRSARGTVRRRGRGRVRLHGPVLRADRLSALTTSPGAPFAAPRAAPPHSTDQETLHCSRSPTSRSSTTT